MAALGRVSASMDGMVAPGFLYFSASLRVAFITPRMLMSHSSGLYYGNIEAAPPAPPDSGSRTSLKALSESLAKQPLKFHPGTGWQYGHSIDVLGRYIESVAGQPLDVVMQERIFGPLKITSTPFRDHIRHHEPLA